MRVRSPEAPMLNRHGEAFDGCIVAGSSLRLSDHPAREVDRDHAVKRGGEPAREMAHAASNFQDRSSFERQVSKQPIFMRAETIAVGHEARDGVEVTLNLKR